MTRPLAPKWDRLEIICASLDGIFREDTSGRYELVPFYVMAFGCIVLELVDETGRREGVGLSLSEDLTKAREAAEGLARSYGVPVADCTRHHAPLKQ